MDQPQGSKPQQDPSAARLQSPALAGSAVQRGLATQRRRKSAALVQRPAFPSDCWIGTKMESAEIERNARTRTGRETRVQIQEPGPRQQPDTLRQRQESVSGDTEQCQRLRQKALIVEPSQAHRHK